MDFRQLTNAGCGQSRPLTQMTTHVTQDNAFQDIIGGPSTVNNFIPQSFRIHDLMQEINAVESRGALRYPVPPTAVNHGPMWAAEYNNLAQTYPQAEAIWEQSTNAVHGLPQATNFYDQGHQATNFYNQLPQAINFPYQSHHSLCLPCSSQRELTTEDIEFFFLNNADYKTIESLDELEDDWEDTAAPQEAKFAQEPIILHWDEHFIEDENHVLKEGRTLSGVELFEEFMKAYIVKYRKFNALVKDPSYKYAKPSPKHKGDEALKRGPLKALNARKRFLQLDPVDLESYICLAHMYLSLDCPYQTCQSLLNWIKRCEVFCDVVPQNFKMVDKITSELDKNVLKQVQNFFIKATQRTLEKPHDLLQTGLMILYKLSGDYEKAADCQRNLLNYYQPEDGFLWVSMGKNLLKAEKPQEALEAFHRAIEIGDNITDAHTNIGICYMNLKNYWKASFHFACAARHAKLLDKVKPEVAEVLDAQLRLSLELLDHELKKDEHPEHLNKPKLTKICQDLLQLLPITQEILHEYKNQQME